MTEELVIMRDRQAVTTSLQVAENFEKELGLTVDYSQITTHHCIVFEAEGYNRIIIWLSNDCFLSLNLSNNPQFAKVAPKVLYIANKFMENYRKIDMEAKA